MYPRGLRLLVSPNSLNQLVKHKLGPIKVISESILMDGMPQVTATIEPRRGGQQYGTCVEYECSTELLAYR